MPLDKFVLILIIVVAAAGVTVALAVFVAASLELPGFGLAILIPISLCAYVVWRVIFDRIGSREDSHYDQIEK